MARSIIIIALLAGLLVSCGQVGEITGGDKDTHAPRVLTQKVKPANNSLHIAPKEIAIPFDEYVEFNKPSENIRVTPADVKLSYKIKRKTVLLKVIDGEWKPNTTYTIYLNRAVKDITEGNDSIMSYVFSTGGFIDSLQTAVQIIDAYTGEPAKNVTVGLYEQLLLDDTSKIDPRYFSSTDKDGVAIFKNIKNESFYLYAFHDENRNNRLDAIESRAALRKPVELDIMLDSIIPQIRLMPTNNIPLKIKNNNVFPATRWCLSFTRPFEQTETIEFIDPQPEYVIWNATKDSLTAYYDMNETSGKLKAIWSKSTLIDTISKPYFFKKSSQLEFTNNLDKGKLLANDTLQFMVNTPIQTIDTSLIELTTIYEKDSVPNHLNYQFIQLSPTEIAFYFEKKKEITKAQMKLSPGAFSNQNYSVKDTVKINFEVQQPRETGRMILEFDTIPPYGILFITSNKKMVYQVVFDGISKNTHDIDFVQPGQYGFYYLLDEDRDGKWSTGSIFEDKEAEKIIWIPDVTTIRANWDVKSKLDLHSVKRKE
ncbi:MAG: Ig-like domain-containing protein [Brumimicrobium sp.]|nr:Ig-like domain-containing protein [Brumimicrobium sp.]